MRHSAGILLHRSGPRRQVLLGHMGGPMWARRERAWTIPKGEVEPGEQPLDTARREFAEELGVALPDVTLTPLGEVRQAGGKVVTAWAGRAEDAPEFLAGFDPDAIAGATVEIEWPPRSGRRLTVPELDRAAWVDVEAAANLIVSAQAGFLSRIPWVPL